MNYVHKVIGADEHLMLVTRLHWIYLVEAFFWLLFFIALGQAVDFSLWYYAGSKIFSYNIDLYFIQFNEVRTPIPWLFGLTGLAIFTPLFLTYISTEIGLTDRRIIHKKGLIMIEVQQVELEDIRGEQVHHGWLGWLLGYGRLHFDCRFIHDVYLPATYDPYRLVKAVHTARMRHDKIPYSVQDLDLDVVRIDTQRLQAFRAREKLKRLARQVRLDFNQSRLKHLPPIVQD